MKVLKFGGTSVGAPERMQQVAQLIDDGQAKIVVLSAVSGTTNSLVAIARSYYDKQDEQANLLVDVLEKKYEDFLHGLYKQESSKERARRILADSFQLLRSFHGALFTEPDEKLILAQGELISTHLFHFYAEEVGLKTALLPALSFMRTRAGEPDAPYIAASLREVIRQVGTADYYITQGYICKNEYGGIDNLQRGGSDYTASLIGAAIDAQEIQIWTDIDGMHNNDPRVVQPTYPIKQLAFEEAAELAYFGAKILHPSSVLPAQKANIPVRLLNTMEPEAPGTIISAAGGSEPGQAKAIAAKDGIIAIRIRSSRMLFAYGFLKKVFEIFENYHTPIDMITTSEVAVSLTVDEDKHLDQIASELKQLGVVEIDREQTIVCVVGSFGKEEVGAGLKVLESLRDIPIRMISSGGSQRNISVLIDTANKEKALIALNAGLFQLTSPPVGQIAER
ncbi:MAG: aspartate kinase [Bacteroidota bacterium]